MDNQKITEAFRVLKSADNGKRALDILLEFYKHRFTNTLVEGRDIVDIHHAQGVLKFIRILEEGLK